MKGVPYELVIIGGGPAGLTAGIYAARDGLNVLLLERGMLGGKVASTNFIENYPGFEEGISGMELAQRMERQAKRFGLKIQRAEVQGITPGEVHRVKTDEGKILTKAIIIATGTVPNKLGVPGEERFRGKGVSYCATCDGAFFRDKIITVVGGGNAALQEALFLTRYGKKVHLIHRRDRLRGSKTFQERALSNPKIHFIWNTVVTQIKGERVVEELVLKNRSTGEIQNLKTDGLFIYVGVKPQSDPFNVVKRDRDGFILVDEDMATSIKGIYAAGDVRAGSPRQVSAAVGDGTIAALAAEEYISSL